MSKSKIIIIIILSIALLVGITYAGKGVLLDNMINNIILERTEQIKNEYDEKAKAYQEQIFNKQIEINKKNALLKVKEKEIKESENRILKLQNENANLIKKLSAIILPTTINETKKRLGVLGYETCK